MCALATTPWWQLHHNCPMAASHDQWHALSLLSTRLVRLEVPRDGAVRQLPPELQIHVAQYDCDKFTSGQKIQHVCGYPLFGRLRRDANVEALVGDEKQPAPVLLSDTSCKNHSETQVSKICFRLGILP